MPELKPLKGVIKMEHIERPEIEELAIKHRHLNSLTAISIMNLIQYIYQLEIKCGIAQHRNPRDKKDNILTTQNGCFKCGHLHGKNEPCQS